MQEILRYLKSNGEKFDSEIAKGTAMSLANVKRSLTELSAKGEIIMCHSIQFTDGKKIEGMRCRLAGYIPPASPGRKGKPRPAAS
jgi:DNA-binding Lrp family transcriptional regulator